MECESKLDIVETCGYKCQLNMLSRSDGSSILSQGDTVVAVSVYGPIEVKQHKVHIDKAFVDVVYRPRYGLTCVGDRLTESIICKICGVAIITSQYPRTGISIIVQELQDFGAVLACSINAVCLALLHSGLSMNYLFAAVTCIVDSDDCITLLPLEKNNLEEEQIKRTTATFVFENTSGKIIATNTSGPLSESLFQECVIKCRHASNQIFEFYKMVIKQYASRI